MIELIQELVAALRRHVDQFTAQEQALLARADQVVANWEEAVEGPETEAEEEAESKSKK